MTASEARDSKALIVWPFDDAPKEFRDLSEHGGDEDWVAFVPTQIDEDHFGYIGFLESPGFGCCDVSRHKVDGGIIYIGAYASQEAVAHGCLCPVIDNHYGRGVARDPGLPAQFWRNFSCPIHGCTCLVDWRSGERVINPGCNIHGTPTPKPSHGTAAEMLAALRAAGGSEWDAIADPVAELRRIRGEE